MPRPLAVAVLALALAGCGEDAPSPKAPAERRTTPTMPARPSAGAADSLRTPFDAAPVVFDTVEPAELAVRIPPPAPRVPERPAVPAPAVPVPAPTPRGPSGSCDVRPAEGYCFTYDGPGWDRSGAERHCGRAPGATFAAAACPTAGAVGTCRFERPEEPGRVLVYVYYAPYPADLAALACPGEFTPSEAAADAR